MLVAGVLFAVMGVFTKLSSARVSSAELVFYRSLIGLLMLLPIIGWRRLPLATARWTTHLSRSLSGFAALVLFFYGIAHLPLATAVTLNYTSPLFLGGLVWVLGKERRQLSPWGPLLGGFVGVVLLLQPKLVTGESVPAMIALASGFFAGLAYLNVRELGRLGEPEWRTVFYFTLLSTAASGLWMLFQPFARLDGPLLVNLLGMGCCGSLAQLAMTRAYRFGPTLLVAALAYITVVVAGVFDAVLWQHTWSILSLTGMAMIVACGVLSTRMIQKNSKAEVTTADHLRRES